MATILNDYTFESLRPMTLKERQLKVLEEDWYNPDIFNGSNGDDPYSGWLEKPQYRISHLEDDRFAVFDETKERDFIGFFPSREASHIAGRKACGCRN